MNAGTPPAVKRNRLRVWLSALGSIAVAGGLIIALMMFASVDVQSLANLVGRIEPLDFSAVVLATLLHTWLGSEKWRIAQSTPTGSIDRKTAFSLTAIGVGFGQILPVHVASSATRAIGSRLFTGGTALRGGATSIYEQFFDVLIVACLAGASALTLLLQGQGPTWVGFATASLAAGFFITTGLARFFRNRTTESPDGRTAATGWRRLLQLIDGPGLLDGKLVVRLFALSIARFAALTLVGISITHTLGLEIPFWKIAAALPFPVIAIALAATPAGLGVNELAMTTALHLLGVPMDVAVQWSLAGRVLATAASLCVCVCGLFLLAPAWRQRPAAKTS